MVVFPFFQGRFRLFPPLFQNEGGTGDMKGYMKPLSSEEKILPSSGREPVLSTYYPVFISMSGKAGRQSSCSAVQARDWPECCGAADCQTGMAGFSGTG